MAKIDVVKAKIDFLKMVMSTIVFGFIVTLYLYNIQTSGANAIVVIVAIVILLIFGLILAKKIKSLFDELETL